MTAEPRWGLQTVFVREPLLKTKIRKEPSPSFSGRFAVTQQEFQFLAALFDKGSVPDFLAAAESFPEPPAKPAKANPAEARTDEFGFPLVGENEDAASPQEANDDPKGEMPEIYRRQLVSASSAIRAAARRLREIILQALTLYAQKPMAL